MDFSSFKISLFSPLAVALGHVPAQTWHPRSVYQVLILEQNFSPHQNITEIKSKQSKINFGNHLGSSNHEMLTLAQNEA